MSIVEAEHGYACTLPMPENYSVMTEEKPSSKKSQGNR